VFKRIRGEKIKRKDLGFPCEQNEKEVNVGKKKKIQLGQHHEREKERTKLKEERRDVSTRTEETQKTTVRRKP